MLIDTVDKKNSLTFTFQDNPGHLLKIGKIQGLSMTFQNCGHPEDFDLFQIALKSNYSPE